MWGNTTNKPIKTITTMRTFIFTKRPHKQVKNRMSCNIYEIVDNKVNFITFCEFTPGLSKGAESEVFNDLIDKSIIPQSLYNISQSVGGGEGYYVPHVEEHGVKILEIE